MLQYDSDAEDGEGVPIQDSATPSAKDFPFSEEQREERDADERDVVEEEVVEVTRSVTANAAWPHDGAPPHDTEAGVHTTPVGLQEQQTFAAFCEFDKAPPPLGLAWCKGCSVLGLGPSGL